MVTLSKRQKALAGKVEPGKQYSIAEAIRLVKACATAKFNECVDVAINLGIDVKKSEQSVRGATVLPHGTGRSVRVAVIAPAEAAEKAQKAGADVVGFEDLADEILKGRMDFDVLIATPDSMRVVGKLGQVLGPRGLMPNPKVGTVTGDVAAAVKSAKQGQVRYRSDKSGIIHCTIGKADFSEKALEENLQALLVDVKRIKPSASKGTYLKKLTISSTMGPGVVVDRSSVGG
jgi:large subunit ribosomal protein L1